MCAPEGPAGPLGSLSKEEEAASCVWDLNGSQAGPAPRTAASRGSGNAVSGIPSASSRGPPQLKAASAP